MTLGDAAHVSQAGALEQALLQHSSLGSLIWLLMLPPRYVIAPRVLPAPGIPVILGAARVGSEEIAADLWQTWAKHLLRVIT